MEQPVNYFGLNANNKFNVIYADPPWLYNSHHVQGAASKKYPCMKTEDICNLPVQQLAAKDCALLLWTTGPKLPDAFRVIEAWGFKYKTVFTVWNKLYANAGTTVSGVGYYTKPSCEFLLVAIRGKLKQLKVPKCNIKQLIHSARAEHSQKPAVVRQRIEEFFLPHTTKIELFSRSKIPDWTVWGNEINKYEYKDHNKPDPSAENYEWKQECKI